MTDSTVSDSSVSGYFCAYITNRIRDPSWQTGAMIMEAKEAKY